MAMPNDVKFENQNGNSTAALPEWSFFMASTAVNAQQAEHIIVCSHWATPFSLFIFNSQFPAPLTGMDMQSLGA
jgi:hypothetical protein